MDIFNWVNQVLIKGGLHLHDKSWPQQEIAIEKTQGKHFLFFSILIRVLTVIKKIYPYLVFCLTTLTSYVSALYFQHHSGVSEEGGKRQLFCEWTLGFEDR